VSASAARPDSDPPARRVLFLSYFFPPAGGGSAQRNVSLVNWFSSLGYEPVVITGDAGADHYWAPVDQSLLAGRPDGARIVRLPGPEPRASGGVRRKAERLLDLSPAWYRWWIDGAREAGLAASAGCDLVYASLEPYETALVASAIARERGIPWGADLLDPWALDEMRLHVTGIHRRRDLRRMRRWLSDADAVIMSTREATRRARTELPEIAPAVVEPIPVGYEGPDFERPAPGRPADGKFRIAHTGFLHTEAGQRHAKTARLRQLTGGLYTPVNLLARSALHLLSAIDRLIAEDPSLAETIEVHLAGLPTDADREVAERSPVARLRGYLSHTDTLALLRTSDMLFLPMQDLPGGRPAGLIPAKTYEYLAAGKPILAAVPRGDARDLLVEAGSARVCDPTDEVALAAHLRAEIERWRAGTPARTPHPEVVRRYERGVVARQLTGVFDDVLERRAATSD
jgi:glycosyltransferase involved in cell wall biosynthesis